MVRSFVRWTVALGSGLSGGAVSLLAVSLRTGQARCPEQVSGMAPEDFLLIGNGLGTNREGDRESQGA